MMQRKPFSYEMWQLEQKSKFSVHRLRYQLAEDGCKESQVSLARTLLRENVSNKKEKCENERIAVHWLLRAAGQGYEEASDLLGECYRNGKGITSYNKEKVETCLNRTEKEKLAHQIGHQLYKAITFDTDEVLLVGTFREKVSLFLTNSNEHPDKIKDTIPAFGLVDEMVYNEQMLMSNGLSKTIVTISDVISSVFQCLEGESPNIFLAENPKETISRWKILQWPSNIFYKVSNELLRIIYVQFVSLAMLLCALSFCILAYIFSPQLVFFKYVVNLISLVSLIIMLFSTGYMISIMMQYYNFRLWLKVIRLFQESKEINCDDNYAKKTVFCFGVFLTTTTIFLLTFPINVARIAHADIAVISILLIYFLEKESKMRTDLRMMSLLLTSFIAMYKVGWIKESWIEILNAVLCWKVTSGVEMKLNFVSILYLPMIFLYFKIIQCSLQHGWYRLLLSHFIALIWVNITAFLLEESQPYDLLRSVILLMVVVIISQYLPVCLAISISYTAKSVSLGITFWNLILLGFISLMFIGYSFICHYFSVLLNKSHKLKTVILLMSVFGLFTFFGGIVITDNNAGPILNWDQYQTYCYQSAWEKSNVAEVETACLHLMGSRIGGEGTVHSVNIRSSNNPLKSLVNIMPSFLARIMKCTLGTQYKNCQHESDSIQYERCLLYHTASLDGCHLEEWNINKFEILLSMTNSQGIEVEIYVDADDVCKSFITHLQNGDEIQIIGTLHANPGSLHPRLKLQSAVCKSCREIMTCDYNRHSFSANWQKVLRFYVRFYFFPLISYTADDNLNM